MLFVEAVTGCRALMGWLTVAVTIRLGLISNVLGLLEDWGYWLQTGM
jgi:hypothetical protein